MATPTTIDTDTELSAVNSILGAIGQSPVTTLGIIDEITGEVTYTGSNARAGTYVRSGTTVEATFTTAHGLEVGEEITIDFASGAADGDYTIVSIPDPDTKLKFTVTTSASGTIAQTNLTVTQSKFDIVSSFTTSSEIKATVNGTANTNFTISGSVLTFKSGTIPATGDTIRIYRQKEIANTLANPEVSFIYNILTEVNKDVQNEG